MGQKVNPIIFRLGINKTWNTELYEIKKSEFPLYTFKCIEIIQFIEKLLKNNNLRLHSYKIHYNQSTLNIYISYFIPITFKNQKHNNKQLILTPDVLYKKIQIFKLTEGLNLFTKKKHKIEIIFKCTNKSFYFLTPSDKFFIKRKLKLLRRFQNKELFNFNETFNLICNAILNKNSSFMISNFVAETLKKLKAHNRFLKCIKQIFKLLLTSKFSKIKSIKIQVTGKLNRSRRTRKKVLIIGSIPIQTLKTKLDYSQTTITHNPKGSFGIKVWTIEK